MADATNAEAVTNTPGEAGDALYVILYEYGVWSGWRRQRYFWLMVDGWKDSFSMKAGNPEFW